MNIQNVLDNHFPETRVVMELTFSHFHSAVLHVKECVQYIKKQIYYRMDASQNLQVTIHTEYKGKDLNTRVSEWIAQSENDN